MNNTKFRMNEATFFLNNMIANKNKYPEFDYFLNAYITSARSVLWIMKSEYIHTDGWKNWYDSIEAGKEKEFLLDGIVDMRNRSTKQQPLQIADFYTIGNESNYFDLSEELKPFDKKRINFKIEEVELKSNIPEIYREENEVKITGKLNIQKTVKEFKSKDIVDICIEYNTWLLNIVDDCLLKFS